MSTEKDEKLKNAIESYLDRVGITGDVERRDFLVKMGKSVLALSAVGAIPGVLAALDPAAHAASKRYRVAFIIFINNPYWQQIKLQVEKLLKPRLAKQGVDVTLVNATASANAVNMSDAIDSAVAQHYDGIIVAGIAPSMDPAIDRAMKKKIPVFTFCCDVPSSERIAFYGPNNYQLGVGAAKLMVQGLQKENILASRGLKNGVIGIETALGFSSLMDRARGFSDEWKKIGPKNVTLLPYFDVKDDAKLVYSKARDAIAAHPNLVGLYVATGSQYALGQAIIGAKKVGKVIGIAHEVFEPTLKVMLKGGIWGVTHDAPIGQVIAPGEAMARLLKTGKKPAHVYNYSEDQVKKYFIYASETGWIDNELKHWNQLFNDCNDGCPDLVKEELK